MFFLGLAGSFMPYLLCLGVLFFLTIGTNNDQELQLAELDDKKIEDFSINDFMASVGNDCYFFDLHSTTKIDHQKSTAAYYAVDFSDNKTQVKLTDFDIVFSGFHYEKNRSGLSPPSLVS